LNLAETVDSQSEISTPAETNRDTREPLFTRGFFRLFGFSFVTFFGAFQFLPVMPLRILDLKGTTAQAGWFLGAFTFASAAAGPLMGSIADRFGRRRFLIVGSLGFIGFAVLYSLIQSALVLIAAGALQGAIWSGLLAASGALFSEVVPISRRAEGFSYWGFASNGAIAISPVLGLKVYNLGWRWLCVEAGGLAVLMFFISLAQREKPHNRPRGWSGLLDGGVLDKGVFKVALSLFMVSFGYGAITSYIALDARSASIRPESLYFTIFASTVLLTRLVTGRLADSVGYTRVLLPSLGLAASGLGVLALPTTRMSFVISALVFGAGFGSCYPAFAARMLELTDPSRRAQTFGSIVAAFDTGVGLGSILLGAVVARYGFQAAFGVAAVIALFSIPLYLVTERGLTRGQAMDRG